MTKKTQEEIKNCFQYIIYDNILYNSLIKNKTNTTADWFGA